MIILKQNVTIKPDETSHKYLLNLLWLSRICILAKFPNTAATPEMLPWEVSTQWKGSLQKRQGETPFDQQHPSGTRHSEIQIRHQLLTDYLQRICKFFSRPLVLTHPSSLIVADSYGGVCIKHRRNCRWGVRHADTIRKASCRDCQSRKKSKQGSPLVISVSLIVLYLWSFFCY